MAIRVAKLFEFSGSDLKTLLDEELKIIPESGKLAADDKYSFNPGALPPVTRGRLEARFGNMKDFLQSICMFIGLVIMNGYRIAGKVESFSTTARILIGPLNLSIGTKGRKIDRTTVTVVGCISACPDIAALLCRRWSKDITSRSVGGWKWDPASSGCLLLAEMYLNGTNSIFFSDTDDDLTKKNFCKLILIHQGCYIASRAAAGTKTAPSNDKIIGGRRKQMEFLLKGFNTWTQAEKEKTWTAINITKDQRNTAMKLIRDSAELTNMVVDNLETDKLAFLNKWGKIAGWSVA